jgi:hypothetical protein
MSCSCLLFRIKEMCTDWPPPLKGSLPRDFQIQVFFVNQCPLQIQRNGANSAKRMQIQQNWCKFSETDPSDNFSSEDRAWAWSSPNEPAISHTSQPGLQTIISSTLQLPGVVAAATDLFSLATTWWRAQLQPWWRARLRRRWRAQLATCHAALKLDENLS